ncbi:unnamed protein product [Prunus armeniaca]|uniref:Leucine-rich repeat-containing N-terminal plant-type domain-containing protein n=1 Tax=Prunus armeniaca TaxID=36596 RepID=A0A6J5V9F3_PRUAR|nr:unnamed protein product [Prunus armeniaca]
MENLTQLIYVDLSMNKFNGSVPFFSMAKNLTPNKSFIQSSDRAYTMSIFYLQGLKILSLSSNNLSGSFPLELLPQLKNLSSLDLSYNSCRLTTTHQFLCHFLSSNYHIEIGILSRTNPTFSTICLYLDYSRNNFNSSIRTDIGDFLSYTTFFSLSSNKFHGSIPGSICNAQNLRPQWQSDRRSVSKISSQLHNVRGFEPWKQSNRRYVPCLLTNISTLRVLVLRSNKFYGRLGCPNTHGNATCDNFESLDLSNNKLGGEIPAELAKLTFLSFLNLSNNQLVGKIPSNAQFQHFQQLHSQVIKDYVGYS